MLADESYVRTATGNLTTKQLDADYVAPIFGGQFLRREECMPERFLLGSVGG